MSTVQKGTVSKGTVSKGNIFPSELAFSGELTSVITSGGSVSVNENVDADTAVYTATAKDRNGVTSGFSFAISTGDSSAFTINSSTGVVTIDASPNFEAQASYSFKVTATKSGQPTATKNVTIAVVNLDEVAPVFTSPSSTIYIAEGIDANEEAYTAVATDTGDGTNGNITYSLTNNAGGRFTIDSSTGVVTNVTPPASGSAWTAGTSQIITIRATDDAGNFADRNQTFFAANPPVFGSGNSGVTVNENQAIFSPPGSGVQASHIFHYVDMVDAESGFDFKLIDSNGDEQNSTGGFNIVSDGSLSLGGGLFKTTSDPAYDHETDASYSITVRAKRKDGPLTYATATINVTVVDQGLTFGGSQTPSVTIAELSSSGTTVYTPSVSVIDPQGGNVEYSLTGTDAGSFDINSSTGVVTTDFVPDYETKTSYSVTVNAQLRNTGSGIVTDTASVALTVNISNVAEPSFNTTTVVTDDDATASTIITNITESGGILTVPSNASITSITTNSNNYVIVSPQTFGAPYQLKLNSNVIGAISAGTDYTGDLSVQYQLTETGSQTHSLSATITTQFRPTITSATTIPNILENFGNDTDIYTITTNKNDATSYSLTGTDANKFSVRTRGRVGIVTLTENPDYDTKSSYSFGVVATKSGAANTSTTHTVTLNVNSDSNEGTSNQEQTYYINYGGAAVQSSVEFGYSLMDYSGTYGGTAQTRVNPAGFYGVGLPRYTGGRPWFRALQNETVDGTQKFDCQRPIVKWMDNGTSNPVFGGYESGEIEGLYFINEPSSTSQLYGTSNMIQVYCVISGNHSQSAFSNLVFSNPHGSTTTGEFSNLSTANYNSTTNPQGVAHPYQAFNVTASGAGHYSTWRWRHSNATIPAGLEKNNTMWTNYTQGRITINDQGPRGINYIRSGVEYMIAQVSTVDWTTVGGPANPVVGDVFTATSNGFGSTPGDTVVYPSADSTKNARAVETLARNNLKAVLQK